MSKPTALYKVGDVVEIHHLPKSMSHFTKGMGCIIEVNHNTCQEGTDWEWGYGIDILDEGRSYWYYDSNLRIADHSTLTYKERLLLSCLYPRLGDTVVYTGTTSSLPEGTSGVVAVLTPHAGMYGIDWEGFGYRAWFLLSEFKGYKGVVHPLEFLLSREDKDT